MFFGAVPRQAISQVARVVPFPEWGRVFVGCSGSFRFDLAVHDAHPAVEVHSNDVSLLSCAIGQLAAGQPMAMRFTKRLAWMEEHLAGRPPADRVAAVWVAQEMAKYRGANPYARAHFQHYQDRFADFLDPAAAKMAAFLDRLQVNSFFAGDFRQQAQRALEAGGGVCAFPPTYKNDYERLYRFVDDNTDWPRPSYDVWDPARLEDWIDELRAMRVRYCVLVEHRLDRHQPATAYYGGIKPVFTYADSAGSSVRRLPRRAEPFRYEACDADRLTPTSKVEVITATTGQMNFLKDIYLKKEIQHTNGIANYLVMIDGRLAGGFIYVRNKLPSKLFGRNSLYVLCDFSLCPKSRLSKLIIMLSSCSAVTDLLETRLMQRINGVCTTAYTDRPVSMKYRGLYELVKRDPGRLMYASPIRRQTIDAVYAEWWQRFVANARHPGPAQVAAPARQERPLHEGAAVPAPGRQHRGGRMPDQPAAGA